MQIKQGNVVCQGEWATLEGKLAKQECPWWASEVRLGGQRRVGGGALGGHYTDGSPQPLTNLDLVLLTPPIIIISRDIGRTCLAANAKTCFHFFHSGSSRSDAMATRKATKCWNCRCRFISVHCRAAPQGVPTLI